VKTQERQILDAMILGADQLSKGITSATWHAMLANTRQAAYEVMETIAHKQGIDRIQIFNKEGRIMFSTRPGDINKQVDKNAEACSLCHASLQPLVRVDVPSRARIFRGADGLRKLAMVTPISDLLISPENKVAPTFPINVFLPCVVPGNFWD
jgi:two-component system NtrC family sensor kinase